MCLCVCVCVTQALQCVGVLVCEHLPSVDCGLCFFFYLHSSLKCAARKLPILARENGSRFVPMIDGFPLEASCNNLLVASRWLKPCFAIFCAVIGAAWYLTLEVTVGPNHPSLSLWTCWRRIRKERRDEDKFKLCNTTAAIKNNKTGSKNS